MSTIKEEPLESEIKIEITESFDENQQLNQINNENCVKSDPDRNYLHILSPKSQKNHLKKIKKEDLTTKKYYKCKFCNEKYSNRSLLWSHIHSQHQEEYKSKCNFHCDLCEYSCKLKHNFTKHMIKIHIINNQFHCDFDGKIYENKKNLRRHMEMHLPNVKCKVCDKEMKANSLPYHMRSVHPLNPSNYQCKICLKDLKSTISLYSHMKSHDKKFKCTVCDRMFSRKSNFKLHMTVHDDNLKLECKICHKKFYSNCSLKNHIKTIHQKDQSKLHKCSQCSYATIIKGSLKQHSKKHDQERPKQFKCTKCDHATNYKSSLMHHLKIHDKNRAKIFKCNRCDFATDQQGNLKKHMRTHEKHDEKVKSWKNPVKCENCWMFSKDESALKIHMKKVHVDAKFQCDLCGKSYKNKQPIYSHFRLIHKIKI